MRRAESFPGVLQGSKYFLYSALLARKTRTAEGGEYVKSRGRRRRKAKTVRMSSSAVGTQIKMKKIQIS